MEKDLRVVDGPRCQNRMIVGESVKAGIRARGERVSELGKSRRGTREEDVDQETVATRCKRDHWSSMQGKIW
jgi:hypothetical protein